MSKTPKVALLTMAEYDERMKYIKARLAEANAYRKRKQWGGVWSSLTRAESELHKCAMDARFLA